MSDYERTRRLEEAKQSYKFALVDKQTRLVLNDRIPKAAARLLQVARGQAPDNEDQARLAAQVNYKHLLGEL